MGKIDTNIEGYVFENKSGDTIQGILDSVKDKANQSSVDDDLGSLSNSLNEHRNTTVLDHPDGSVTTAKIANGAVSIEKLDEDLQNVISSNADTNNYVPYHEREHFMVSSNNGTVFKKIEKNGKTLLKDVNPVEGSILEISCSDDCDTIKAKTVAPIGTTNYGYIVINYPFKKGGKYFAIVTTSATYEEDNSGLIPSYTGIDGEARVIFDNGIFVDYTDGLEINSNVDNVNNAFFNYNRLLPLKEYATDNLVYDSNGCPYLRDYQECRSAYTTATFTFDKFTTTPKQGATVILDIGFGFRHNSSDFCDAGRFHEIESNVCINYTDGTNERKQLSNSDYVYEVSGIGGRRLTVFDGQFPYYEYGFLIDTTKEIKSITINITGDNFYLDTDEPITDPCTQEVLLEHVGLYDYNGFVATIREVNELTDSICALKNDLEQISTTLGQIKASTTDVISEELQKQIAEEVKQSLIESLGGNIIYYEDTDIEIDDSNNNN